MTEQPAGGGPAQAASITGRDDPEEESPWAMQLVVRVDRVAPPARTPVCEAAATAVARLLADDRALPGGAWFPQIRRWTDDRIRKHCRRARGVAWDRVQELPGVTADVAGACVRALVPTSTADIPREVARLQLSGRELDDPHARTAVDPEPNGPVVVSICPDPVLPLGKAAAAAGHAAQLAAWRMAAGHPTTERMAGWAATGFAVTVEHPDRSRWARLRPVAGAEVVDAGLTAVPAGTCTALARWA